jgi:hypothetical protein
MNVESALAPSPSISARALASRINGAKSRGPRTAAGKARSARNALKHGLCARKIAVFPNEDATAFFALETALVAELAPVGVLQTVLAQRVVSAAWRLMRADRLEAEVLEERRLEGSGLGLALIRDGNGTRSVETVVRYRAAALAELMRCLRTLEALQAEAPAAPARRRRGRPIVPARGRATQASAAQAPRPAPVPTAQDERAGPPARPSASPARPSAPPARPTAPDPDRAAAAPAPAARCAPTKRTRDTTPEQGPDVQSPDRIGPGAHPGVPKA